MRFSCASLWLERQSRRGTTLRSKPLLTTEYLAGRRRSLGRLRSAGRLLVPSETSSQLGGIGKAAFAVGLSFAPGSFVAVILGSVLARRHYFFVGTYLTRTAGLETWFVLIAVPG